MAITPHEVFKVLAYVEVAIVANLRGSEHIGRQHLDDTAQAVIAPIRF